MVMLPAEWGSPAKIAKRKGVAENRLRVRGGLSVLAGAGMVTLTCHMSLLPPNRLAAH